MTDRHDCDEVGPALAELATGAATGHDRARALQHAAGCDSCRRELAQLSKVADELLLLAPPREPPAGFESAVMARLDTREPASPRRLLPGRRRPAWLRLPHRPLTRAAAGATAVLLAAALGAGVVWQSTADDRRIAAEHEHTLRVADGRYLKALPVTAESGTRTGTVFLYQGNPSWLLVTVAGAPADGPYQMVVVDRDGVSHPGGTCLIAGGAGTAGYHLYQPVAEVAVIQLNGPGGVRLTARA
jgi:hypothetical protein